MISQEIIIGSAFAYMAFLFYVAWRGDREDTGAISRYQPVVYTLSLTVYCTTWTFFGAVGNAAGQGLAFFSIYLGPILVFVLFYPMVRKLVRVSLQQKTTTIADFIATRYGKSNRVAAAVAVIALIGTLPYISLQIKAISDAYEALASSKGVLIESLRIDTAFLFTLLLAAFAVLFGARTIDASAHHRGMMHAISVESVVKLAAFLLIAVLAVGLIVELATARNAPDPLTLMWAPFTAHDWGAGFWTKTLLAGAAILLLPRQFHVLAVEARGGELPVARWGFPLYLLLFSVAVIPITAAGLQVSEGLGNADLFVLYLPMQGGHDLLAILAYLGGFSAAMGMVIVATLALSTMVSNDLIFPYLVRRGQDSGSPAMHQRLLLVRRLAIPVLMLLAYGYYQIAGSGKSLYSIGLLSFAAAIQFLPAVVGGLYWKTGHRHGVLAGLAAGFGLWLYTLLLPSLGWIDQGLFGWSWLRPDALFGGSFDDSLTHGVFWSLLANVAAYVGVSIRAKASLTDRLQASAYVDMAEFAAERYSRQLRLADLFELCSRFTGEERALQCFGELGLDPRRDANHQVPPQMLAKAQRLLGGSIGTATAEHLITAAVQASEQNAEQIYQLLDTTGQALQFNREILQVTLDHIGQAVSVVDEDLCLVAWNRLYVAMFDFPADFLHVGKPIEQVIRFNVERGLGPDYAVDIEQNIHRRLDFLRHGKPYTAVRDWRDGRVIQTEGARLPDGGFITTFTDITQLKTAERELAATNETLEGKVEDRTQMLSELNAQLEASTQSKSRFLAAASHDLTQPLSASKLYLGTLQEELAGERERAGLAQRALGALETAESLLRSLLDISKLDAGAMTPDIQRFPVQRLLDSLDNEFSVLAAEKGLTLRIPACDYGIQSDPQLLRSILQNFLANALRYTDKGAVMVVCRRAADQRVRIEVRDAGRGIPPEKMETVFEEFSQLDRSSEGVGLGLAIAHRLAMLLKHPLDVRSLVAVGSVFSVSVPKAGVVETDRPHAVRMPVKTRWLEGARVLCVDDDQEILQATQAVFTRWGAKVSTCADVVGFEAASTDARPYDIVFADYQLHDELTGLDLLQRYRQQHAQAFVGVLFTAEQNRELRKAVQEAGFEYLEKPIEPAKIRSVLQMAMREREQIKADAAP